MNIVRFLIVAAVTTASARPSKTQKVVHKVHGGNMRLRRNPRLSSHPLSGSKVSFQKDDIDANARELNIFLRNVASLLDSSMSMPVPTSSPTAAKLLDITGNDSLTTPSQSPAATTYATNSTGSNPEPMILPTQLPTLAPVQLPARSTDSIPAGSECVPLDHVPGSNDIAVNVAISYELVIETDADISDILSELEAFMQEYLSVAASGCGSSESRLLLSGSDLDHRRKLHLSAIDSYGISDTPRLDAECQQRAEEVNEDLACYVVDGGVTLYTAPNTTEEAINAQKEKILSLIGEAFIQKAVPGIIGAELIEAATSSQAEDLSEASTQAENMEAVSTTFEGLPIIGAVFIAVGIVGVLGFVAYRWKRNKHHLGDFKGVERLNTSDSYQSDAHTNDVTAIGDTTATQSSESPIVLDFSNDAQLAYTDTQGSDLDVVSVDTGAAVREPVLPSELRTRKGIEDGDTVDFEAADGSGDTVTIPRSPSPPPPPPPAATASKTTRDEEDTSISPYCYPCLWTQIQQQQQLPDEDEESNNM
mmetsp:Transcript_11263/g.23700  ORF Transcript_11263/g.23700 Transcript_11263/m.23700 type:complete len:534 (+) Transcript_11263:1398-2999(+)